MGALDDFRAAREAYPIEGPVMVGSPIAWGSEVICPKNTPRAALIAAAINLALEADRAKREDDRFKQVFADHGAFAKVMGCECGFVRMYDALFVKREDVTP
jgi:hypothetical protein